MVMDQIGRAWQRITPDTLLCEDGSILRVGSDWTDEQAALSVLATVLAGARAGLDAAVETHLNATAQGLGYTDMARAATYATSKVFGVQAQALVDWRDAVWLHCYQALADVEAGKRPIPAEAELIAELPVFAG
jgi:hypothetical protein